MYKCATKRVKLHATIGVGAPNIIGGSSLQALCTPPTKIPTFEKAGSDQTMNNPIMAWVCFFRKMDKKREKMMSHNDSGKLFG